MPPEAKMNVRSFKHKVHAINRQGKGHLNFTEYEIILLLIFPFFKGKQNY